MCLEVSRDEQYETGRNHGGDCQSGEGDEQLQEGLDSLRESLSHGLIKL